MIAKLLHKAFSVSMSLIVLCSTVSFTIEKHFCGDKLVDVALFSEAEKCKMEALAIEQVTITKKPCCKDKVDLVKGQDELIVKSFDDLEFNQKTFIAAFTYSYINGFEGLPQTVVPFEDYIPPLLIKDRQVLDQVFLI